MSIEQLTDPRPIGPDGHEITNSQEMNQAVEAAAVRTQTFPRERLASYGPDGQTITSPEQAQAVVDAAAVRVPESDVDKARRAQRNRENDAWDKLHGLRGQ